LGGTSSPHFLRPQNDYIIAASKSQEVFEEFEMKALTEHCLQPIMSMKRRCGKRLAHKVI
jgi:hypothetical protein